MRLKDVARVELGAFQYGRDVQLDDVPVAGIAVQLLPNANALAVAEAVKARMKTLAAGLPTGVSWFVPYDSTDFILISIHEVVKTLIEAMILVFIVMLVFLQNLRATLIPTLVVPVALMGAFIGMYAFGFTINQLTLFGMVLAIGIVVDDAIVVIENVERIMREEKRPAGAATRIAMGQITGAIVAITSVLAAVFIPSALQGGSVGVIYRQFALTIAVSTACSAFLALSFTPALCASILKDTHTAGSNAFFRWFNRTFEWTLKTYTRQTGEAVGHAPRWMIGFAVIVVLCGLLFARLPGSFLPEEDQGYALALVQLPPGAAIDRTIKVMSQVNAILKQNSAVRYVFQVSGFSFIGVGDNVGLAFIRLKPWDARKTNATDFIKQANGALFMGLKDAQAFVVNLPTVNGLSQFGGFDMYLQDRVGAGHAALVQAQNQLLGKAAQNPDLAGVHPNVLQDSPELQLALDRIQAQSMGFTASDVYTALQLMLAPVYVNDFFYQGRILRVVIQSDAPFRMSPDALGEYYLPSSLPAARTPTAPTAAATGGVSNAASGNLMPMVPLSSVVHSKWVMGSPSLVRFNGYSAIEVQGQPAPSKSSGEAMHAMESIITNDLPKGFSFDWAGQSLQEIVSGSQAPMLFALSILVVFLCLAALYESWTIPIAVLLIVPLGVLGAVVAADLRGLPNDVYFKIGLITIIGLAAKNAILIVEFAVEQQQQGKSLREAVVEAGRLRMRPILMTSFAFILGVLPLALSSGAGANSRHAIGTGVVGGMLFATFLGLLLVPVFYVAIRRLLGEKLDAPGRDTRKTDKVI